MSEKLVLRDDPSERVRRLTLNRPQPDGSSRAETVSVRIPPGVSDGGRIRLRGKGGPGSAGGPSGDLYARIRVRPHPVFRREENNLSLDVPLSVREAVLGAAREERERKSVLVVEVVSILETGRLDRENACAHLLRGRLPVAARDRDERAAKLRAVTRGERAECARPVLHGDHDRVRGQTFGRRVAAFDHEAGGAVRHCVREEAVRVVIRTSNRDEELIRLE